MKTFKIYTIIEAPNSENALDDFLCMLRHGNTLEESNFNVEEVKNG